VLAAFTVGVLAAVVPQQLPAAADARSHDASRTAGSRVVVWPGDPLESRTDLASVELGSASAVMALTRSGSLLVSSRGRLQPVPTALTRGVDDIAQWVQGSLALKDGRIIGWQGSSTTPPPAGLPTSGVDAIAGDGFQVLALRNGRVHAPVQDPSLSVPVPVAAQSGVDAIAVGGRGALALKRGRVIQWSTVPGLSLPAVPSAARSGVDGVAAGGAGFAAVKDGRLIVWNDSLPDDSWKQLTGVRSVDVGANHMLVRTTSGLVALGSGPLGIVPAEARLATEFSAGWGTSAAVVDGRLVRWGAGSGLTDVPEGLSNVTDVAVGPYAALAVSDGRVVAWGAEGSALLRVPAAARAGVSQVALTTQSAMALRNGRVITWGDAPLRVPKALLSGVDHIEGGGSFGYAIKNGRVYVLAARGRPIGPVPVAAQSGVTAVSGGFVAALAVRNGRVIHWSPDGFGGAPLVLPAALSAGVTDVAAGGAVHLALQGGRVIAFGDSLIPPEALVVPRAARSGVDAIATDGSTFYALKNGRLTTWGLPTALPNLGGDVLDIEAAGGFGIAVVR
jgi:hypothetical protein